MPDFDEKSDDRNSEIFNLVTNPAALLLSALIWLSGGAVVAFCWWYANSFMRVVWAFGLLLWLVVSPLLVCFLLVIVSFVLMLSNKSKAAESVSRIASDFMPIAWLPLSAAGMPVTSIAMDIYCMSLIANNKFAESFEVARDSLKKVETKHGKSSPHLIDPLLSFANSCKYAGRFAEGLDALNQALAISKSQDGINMLLNVRRVHGDLGYLYRAALIFDLARANFESTINDNNNLKKMAPSFNGVDQDTAVKLKDIAEICFRQDKLEDADKYLSEAEPILMKKGREALQADFNRVSAMIRAKQARFEEADVYLNRVMELAKKCGGDILTEQIDNLACAAFVAQKKGDSNAALKQYQDLLALCNKVYGTDSIQTAEMIVAYADCLDSVGRAEDANQMRQKAEAIEARVWTEIGHK